ncbi:peptidase inhibitor family I36 protein, partial [Amycolatopsis anabasis]|uniref:peptidase inhibitor family I36 protein n=1 Tax=Amycolatopsis anabasis TaxID=1840409 RepID=UPI001C552D9C
FVRRLVATGAAVSGLFAMAAPAEASDEAILPVRTGVVHQQDGAVTSVQEPDYAEARLAPVRAKAATSCPANLICLYEDIDAGGQFVALPGPPPGVRVWNDWLGKEKCTCYGPNKRGHSGDFNDQMSSFVNNTATKFWWYFDINGQAGSPRFPAGSTYGGYWNLPPDQADEASSIYSWI